MADPEALFATHQQRVFKYFCRAVGRADIAHDLTQEAFLRVSRSSTLLTGHAGRGCSGSPETLCSTITGAARVAPSRRRWSISRRARLRRMSALQ
jgi:hypothetical protein